MSKPTNSVLGILPMHVTGRPAPEQVVSCDETPAQGSMMPSKYDQFADALRALCRRHHVSMAPSRYGTIAIYNTAEGADDSVIGLEDRTGGTVTGVKQPDELPDHFATAIEAAAFPGYMGHAPNLQGASQMSVQHTGSHLVPIGKPKFVRGWAVIKHYR